VLSQAGADYFLVVVGAGLHSTDCSPVFGSLVSNSFPELLTGPQALMILWGHRRRVPFYATSTSTTMRWHHYCRFRLRVSRLVAKTTGD